MEKRKLQPYFCSSSLNTYQERQREWPNEALATVHIVKGAKSNSLKSERDKSDNKFYIRDTYTYFVSSSDIIGWAFFMLAPVAN